jgi:hypothetical protein
MGDKLKEKVRLWTGINSIKCRIWDVNGGDMGYDPVCVLWKPTFRRNVSPPSSGLKKYTRETKNVAQLLTDSLFATVEHFFWIPYIYYTLNMKATRSSEMSVLQYPYFLTSHKTTFLNRMQVKKFTYKFTFVGAFHGILPHVVNIDDRSATVLLCKCSLLCNSIPIATHTRNSTVPSLLWYGLVKQHATENGVF